MAFVIVKACAERGPGAVPQKRVPVGFRKRGGSVFERETKRETEANSEGVFPEQVAPVVVYVCFVIIFFEIYIYIYILFIYTPLGPRSMLQRLGVEEFSA